MATAEASLRNPAYQVFLWLRVGFTVAPILFGLDKFFHVMVDWDRYLAPWINDLMPGSASDFMRLVGGIEIAAGVLVALLPRFGAPLVALWLTLIVVNLLTYAPSRTRYWDIALRDIGLVFGALALARLAWAFHGKQPQRVPASSASSQHDAAAGGAPGRQEEAGRWRWQEELTRREREHRR